MHHLPSCPDVRREAALEEYKQGPGAPKASLLVENRARVKELKRRAKVCVRVCVRASVCVYVSIQAGACPQGQPARGEPGAREGAEVQGKSVCAPACVCVCVLAYVSMYVCVCCMCKRCIGRTVLTCKGAPAHAEVAAHQVSKEGRLRGAQEKFISLNVRMCA